MAKARALTGLDPTVPTAQAARAILRARLADMYAFTQYIDYKEHIQELHGLRIAAKRVRYSLELFAACLPFQPDHFIAELVQLQDELGELHDCEVMLALLRLSLRSIADPKGQAESSLEQNGKPLLAADLVARIKSVALPPVADSLVSFLHRQELRREQSYQAFLQHWARLEQTQFREQFLACIGE